MRIIFLFTLLLGILGVFALPIFALDQRPMFKTSGISKLSDLKAATRRVFFPKKRGDTSNIRRVTMTITELTMVLNILNKTKKYVTFRARVSRFGLIGGLVIEAPFLRNQPFDKLGSFINIRFLLLPSAKKIDIARLAIGKLEIPSTLIQGVFETTLAYLLGSERQRVISRSFRLLDIRGQKLTFQFKALNQ
ncbi:MAG: hypothetical protein VW235_03480 [Rhodospirillaceae bacterium]